MIDSHSKHNLRADPARTKRAEQNDKAMQRLRKLRDSKKRKNNIREQREALSQQLDKDYQGKDGEDDSASLDGDDSELDKDAHKVTSSNKPASLLASTNVDEGALKPQLIAKIAMRDQRTDHFNFSLKELKMVWENGNMHATQRSTAQASERIAGAFDDEQLLDLGTVEADDSINTKGAKIRKGYIGSTRLKIQKLLRASSPSVASSRISSPHPSKPPPRRSIAPVMPTIPRRSSLKTHILASSTNAATNKQGTSARSASLHHAGSNLTDNIEWDIDSEEEEVEFNRIEQDDAVYDLGETSCDEGKPKKKGKPKSSDYQGLVRTILEATLDKVFAILLSQGFFIDAKELDKLIARTWRFCAIRIVDDPTLNRYSISLNKLRAIKYRITSWQGKLKDSIKPKVAGAYGLTGTLDEIKVIVDRLLDHDFHTRPGAEHGTGYYQHFFLQTACDVSIFNKRKGKPPIGVKFSKMFVKMPLPTIALLCAIIHFLLETCRSGNEEHDNTIIREMVEEYYHDHLQNLLTLAKADPDTADRIRTRMYERGIKRAPVKPAITVKPEPKAGGRILSIKDIVPAKLKPAMDSEDENGRAESETTEGQGEGEHDGANGNGEEEGRQGVGEVASGAEDESEGGGGDEGEIETKSEAVPRAKSWAVDEEVGRDSEDEEQGVMRGRQVEQAKGKGAKKGHESRRGRLPVNDEGASQTSGEEGAAKGMGEPVPRAKKVVPPASPIKSRLRTKMRSLPSTDRAPESGTEGLRKNEGSRRGEPDGAGRRGSEQNGGKRKTRMSANGALAVSESPRKRNKRATVIGV